MSQKMITWGHESSNVIQRIPRLFVYMQASLKLCGWRHMQPRVLLVMTSMRSLISPAIACSTLVQPHKELAHTPDYELISALNA